MSFHSLLTRNQNVRHTAHARHTPGIRRPSKCSIRIGGISVAVESVIHADVAVSAVVAVGRPIAQARRVFHHELAPRPLVEGAKDPHARGAPKPQQREPRCCDGKR